MQKVKQGDIVEILTGKDKGKTGTVLRILDGLKVIVEGINLVKKATKPDPAKDNKGGIVTKEAAIDISNIAIFNSATKKRDKIAIKILENGKKVRIFKSTKEVVDV